MENIEQRVKKIVAEQLGVNETEIKNESSFVDDLGADSLDTVELVITGLGIIAPVGIGLKTAWDNIVAGRSGITRITRFDASPFPTQIAGEVKNFDVGQYLSPKEARRFDTFIHYGLVASMEAIKDAGLEVTPE